MRVLCVDDEDSLLVTLAANLELEGFEVVEARSGEAALEALRGGGIDLVLSDIRMPGMSGVELFRQVRTIDANLPVILMTAFAVEDLVASAVERGVFAVLPKPFEITHVVHAILRAGSSPLVLVVDDSKETAETTAAALASSGVPATQALDGQTALAEIAGGRIDVCVVDMIMPGMDGAELIRRVREHDGSIACIAVSGEDADDMLRRVASLGAVPCMRKPVATGELVHAIAAARGRPPSTFPRRP